MLENTPKRAELLSLTSEIVAAYAGNNPLTKDTLPELIAQVFSTVSGLGAPEPEPEQKPAVPLNRSVTKKALICLECGKEAKMLKRHLAGEHGLTPEQYREKWRLAPNYPMVSPEYAIVRSKLAKRFGLGSKARTRGPSSKKKS